MHVGLEDYSYLFVFEDIFHKQLILSITFFNFQLQNNEHILKEDNQRINKGNKPLKIVPNPIGGPNQLLKIALHHQPTPPTALHITQLNKLGKQSLLDLKDKASTLNIIEVVLHFSGEIVKVLGDFVGVLLGLLVELFVLAGYFL